MTGIAGLVDPSEQSAMGREPPSEPATERMSFTTSVGCASWLLLAVEKYCRESKTVLYGVQFSPSSGS